MLKRCITLGLCLLLAPIIQAAESAMPSPKQAAEASFERIWSAARQLAATPRDDKDRAWLLQVDRQVITPYLVHWDLSTLLTALLGEQFQAPNTILMQELQSALSNTLARYVVEVLVEHELEETTLRSMTIVNSSPGSRIDIELEGPFGLPANLVYFLAEQPQTGALKIVDMAVGNIRYSEWKSRRYKRYARAGQWSALSQALRDKNSTFFSQFCTPLAAAVDVKSPTGSRVPDYLTIACAP